MRFTDLLTYLSHTLYRRLSRVIQARKLKLIANDPPPVFNAPLLTWRVKIRVEVGMTYNMIVYVYFAYIQYG